MRLIKVGAFLLGLAGVLVGCWGESKESMCKLDHGRWNGERCFYRGQCETSAECDDGECGGAECSCQGNYCTRVIAPDWKCTADSQCSGLHCRADGYCVCQSDSECDGAQCLSYGACGQCRRDADCRDGLRCNDARCAAP